MRYAIGTIIGFLALSFTSFNSALASDLRSNDAEIAFSLDADDNDSATTIDFAIKWGIFLTNTHEVGAVVSYESVDPDVGAKFESGNAGIFYTYNFDTLNSSIVPFMGLQATLPFSDSTDTEDYSLKPYFGLRFLPTYSVSLNTGLFYEKTYTNAGSDPDRFGLEAGFSILF